MKTEHLQGTRSDGEIIVFSITGDAKCTECGEELPRGSLLRIEQRKPLCLACADLDHLVFLPRGDVALTRRSRKHSKLSAVVLRFSRSRGHYERQGLLVESDALSQAEVECLTDEASRDRARERAGVVREKQDEAYIAKFAAQIMTRYQGCPVESADVIAGHACLKHSGRVGRTAGAKQFDAEAIDLAVRAFIRHQHTNYDRSLNRGMDRAEARLSVAAEIEEVAARWRGLSPLP